MSSTPVWSDPLNIWAACVFLYSVYPYVGVQQGGILYRMLKSMVEGIPRMMKEFPCGKPESEQKSSLSNCCVVLTGETTRLIEEKELIVSGTF